MLKLVVYYFKKYFFSYKNFHILFSSQSINPNYFFLSFIFCKIKNQTKLKKHESDERN